MSADPRRSWRCGCVAALLAFAGGCMVGPDYARPEISTPSGYRFQGSAGTLDPGAAASLADRPWWEVFDDPILSAHIDEVLRRNLDLAAAAARVQQAQAIRQEVQSQLLPQVGYGAGISQGKNEFLGTPALTGGSTSGKALLNLSMAWEIDVWGRIRRADQAALAELMATEEARKALMLSLVSEVAAIYFDLQGLDQSLFIARESAVTFGETVTFFADRADAGVASDLPVLRSQAALAAALEAIPETERKIARLENAMAVLKSKPPAAVERRQLSTAVLVPEVPVGLPSQLLERRPDVRQAEDRLKSACARIGVATGNFFPQIGLTGLLGRVSPELSAFSSGSANMWSVAANMTGPIFEGGRLTAELEASKAVFSERAAQYEQTVYVALREVADALVDREKLASVEVQQRAGVEALSGSVTLAFARFNAGKASYFEILEAEQQLFPAQLRLALTETERLIAYVGLYKALGGGWKLPDATWTSDGSPTAPPPPAPR